MLVGGHGYRLTLSFSAALLGATLFLLNFCITNISLAGMVDSAEGCFLLVIVWSLLTGRWFLLPLWEFSVHSPRKPLRRFAPCSCSVGGYRRYGETASNSLTSHG